MVGYQYTVIIGNVGGDPAAMADYLFIHLWLLARRLERVSWNWCLEHGRLNDLMDAACIQKDKRG